MAHISRFPILNVFPFGRGSPPGAAHKTVFPFGFSVEGAPPDPPVDALPDPTAYWGFDEVIGLYTIVDEIHDRNQLSMETGGSEQRQPGGVFGGYHLGNIYDGIHTTQVVSPTSDMTVTGSLAVSVWLRTMVGATEFSNNTVWEHAADGYATLYVWPTTGECSFAYTVDGVGKNLIGNADFSDWVHVFAMMDSTGHYLYFDGVLVDFDTSPIDLPMPGAICRSVCEVAAIDELGLFVNVTWTASQRNAYAAAIASGLFFRNGYLWISQPPVLGVSLSNVYILTGAMEPAFDGIYEFEGLMLIPGPGTGGVEYEYTVWRMVGQANIYFGCMGSSFAGTYLPPRTWWLWVAGSEASYYQSATQVTDPTTILAWTSTPPYELPGPMVDLP